MRYKHGPGPVRDTQAVAECAGAQSRPPYGLPLSRPAAGDRAAGVGAHPPAPLRREGPLPGPAPRLPLRPHPLPLLPQGHRERGSGSESLRGAICAFGSLGEEEKASFFALIAGRLPSHAGALYAGFDALDPKQKVIFVSLLAHSKDVGVLLGSETGRLLIDGLLRDLSETLLASVEVMDPGQKKRLLSLLCTQTSPCAFPPLSPASAEGGDGDRGRC